LGRPTENPTRTERAGGFNHTPADRWASPAPCEGWTATDVVAHVSGNIAGIAAALTGTEAAAFDPDDPVGSWTSAKDRVLAAVETADLATEIPGPFGPMPAEQLIGRLVCTDVMVHTWDLARAVGDDERLNQDDVAQAYSGLKPMDAMIRQPACSARRPTRPRATICRPSS
jgi:uncharacterized protein (TIGR03086 family)